MPTLPALNFTDYLKAAFNWKPRTPGLGNLPLNWLFLGGAFVAGLANPGFWLLGAALELSYLIGLSSSKRFQKLVVGDYLLAQRESFDDKLERSYQRLSTPSQVRYRQLWQSCQRAVGISEVLDRDFTGLGDQRLSGLNQLLAIFLRLLTSRELISDTLNSSNVAEIEKEMARIESRLAAEPADSPLHRSWQGTVDIQHKRLENFRNAQQSLALIEAELERIEQHVVLIGEEAAMTGRTEALTDRLDTVTSALSETNRWLEQNAEIFGSLETDSLLSPAPAALTRAPVLELPEGPDISPPSSPRSKRKTATRG